MVDAWLVVGLALLLGLVINMLVTGVIVGECMDRGCCKDEDDTLASCVATGYPNATVL